MSSRTTSATVLGIEAIPVEVEADVAQGLPAFTVVGLPDTSVQESRERVRAAIRNSGLPFPHTKVTVNLAPADIRKEGSSFDLAIAVAVLATTGVVPADAAERHVFLGELALDGSLRPVSGVLPAAAMAARKGIAEVFLPPANADEAALVMGPVIRPTPHIATLVRHLRGESLIAPHVPRPVTAGTAASGPDFADIRGQASAKRAMEIGAAGGHNVLLSGPPGSGKTLLAKALPSILPDMTKEEALEVTTIYSVAGLLTGGVFASSRPFRSPHHTSSGGALVGGGSWPKPGEVSLAHRGVLFLDEFPEFSRAVLENLRQPMEDGAVTVSRVNGTVRFPAKFMLVAAQNPCPCGYASDPVTPCTCAPAHLAAYRKKISGPIIDRIDICADVPRVTADEYFRTAKDEPSSAIRARVAAARSRQTARLSGSGIFMNAEIDTESMRGLCALSGEAESLLRAATEKLRLTARACGRIIRVARTIADLADSDEIASAHVAEAIQFRERKHAG